MSLEMNTFVKSIDDSIVPQWLSAFEVLGMKCEIHPEFSFADQTGFLPFKLSLSSPAHKEWEGKSFLTGFEFDISDFDLNMELEKLNPKPSALKKWFGKPEPYKRFANSSIDSKLANCRKIIHFVWGSADTFELRMASVSSAILAELTDGICAYPADDEWYENVDLAEKMAAEAHDFESSLKPGELRVHEFDAWS